MDKSKSCLKGFTGAGQEHNQHIYKQLYFFFAIRQIPMMLYDLRGELCIPHLNLKISLIQSWIFASSFPEDILLLILHLNHTSLLVLNGPRKLGDQAILRYSACEFKYYILYLKLFRSHKLLKCLPQFVSCMTIIQILQWVPCQETLLRN